MHTYALTPAYLQQVKTRLLFVAIPMLILIGITILWVGRLLLDVPPGFEKFFAACLSLGFIITIWWTYRQQRKVLCDFRLTTGVDWIKRTQPGFPDVMIHAREVSRLEELPGLGIQIYTQNRRMPFLVPSTIEDYAELREYFAAWHPIDVKSASAPRLQVTAGFLIVALELLAFGILFTTQDIIIAGISSGYLISVSVLSMLVTLRGHRFLPKSAGGVLAWGAFALVLAAVIFRLAVILF